MSIIVCQLSCRHAVRMRAVWHSEHIQYTEMYCKAISSISQINTYRIWYSMTFTLKLNIKQID